MQGHTNINNESNKCSIILEAVQAVPIKFSVKIVRLRSIIKLANAMTLTLTEGHNCVSNFTFFLTCTIIVKSRTIIILAMAFRLGMTVDLNIMHGNYMLMLVSMTFDLDARSQWVGRGRK